MMLYYENGWHICKEKVRYIQYNKKEIIKCVGSEGRDWWVDFANKWEDTKIIEFIPVEPTEEQLKRYEEIKNMPEDFGNIYSEYVRTGDFIERLKGLPENHPFKIIMLKHENETLGQSLTDTELENMSQGQQLTDIELRLLELEENKNA